MVDAAIATPAAGGIQWEQIGETTWTLNLADVCHLTVIRYQDGWRWSFGTIDRQHGSGKADELDVAKADAVKASRAFVLALCKALGMSALTDDELCRAVGRVAQEQSNAVRRGAAETFTFKSKGEYAVFVVDGRPRTDAKDSSGYYALLIESSFGGFAFAWSHPGGDFRDFLAGLGCDYVSNKMVREPDVADWAATTENIRAELLNRRRAREISANDARAEWQLLESDFDGEHEFWSWARDSEEFKDDVHEFIRTVPCPRARDFNALYDLFWPEFAAALKPAPVVEAEVRCKHCGDRQAAERPAPCRARADGAHEYGQDSSTEPLCKYCRQRRVGPWAHDVNNIHRHAFVPEVAQ